MNSRTFTYKTVPSCEIRADVFWEDPPRDQHLPIVLWLHGGGLIAGCRTDIKPDQKFLYVSAGFAVVCLDYRLAPETKLLEIIQDLQDGIHWVRNELPAHVPIDPRKIAVVGHSAGGYLTLMSGFCIHPPLGVLVSFYGYGDITAPWYSRPDPFFCQLPRVSKEKALQVVGKTLISFATGSNSRWEFYLYCRQKGLWPREVSGFDPVLQNAAFDPYCPVRNVTKSYPPTMLLHGTHDTDVPRDQSWQMAGILEKAMIPYELIFVPNGVHGFDGRGLFDPVVGPLFTRVVDFIMKYIH